MVRKAVKNNYEILEIVHKGGGRVFSKTKLFMEVNMDLRVRGMGLEVLF